MKRKNAWGKFVVLFYLALSLVACSGKEANESSQYERLADNPLTSSSTVSAASSSSSSQSASARQTESSGNPMESSVFFENSSSSSSSLTDVSSQSSSASEAKPGVSITVKKLNLIDAKEKVISDETQMKKILAFVEGMFESDFTGPPPTGGEIMSVFVTRDGIAEEYSFLEDEVDGYVLAKNHQHPDVKNVWYFADAESFPYLSDLLQ